MFELSRPKILLEPLRNGDKLIHKALLVFFIAAAVFYIICKFLVENIEGTAAVTLKCAPICFLIVFILSVWRFRRPNRYPVWMIVGLTMSMVGDAFLTQEDDIFFLSGLATFALAHVMYIKAFSFRPLRLTVAVKIYLFAFFTAIIYLLVNCHVTQRLEGIKLAVISVGLLVYAALLYGTLWRAIARVTNFHDLFKWNNMTKCIGTCLFIFSDNVLAVNKFIYTIPYAWVPVMLTYYGAQLSLALSVVRHTEDGQFECYKTPPTSPCAARRGGMKSCYPCKDD